LATLLECLKSLPQNLVMRDASAIRNEVATVSEHIARLGHDEDGYEVREERRNYGKDVFKVVGKVDGLTVYRQV